MKVIFSKTVLNRI